MSSMTEATSFLHVVLAHLVTRSYGGTTDVFAHVCEYKHLDMNALYEYSVSYQLDIGDW